MDAASSSLRKMDLLISDISTVGDLQIPRARARRDSSGVVVICACRVCCCCCFKVYQ